MRRLAALLALLVLLSGCSDPGPETSNDAQDTGEDDAQDGDDDGNATPEEPRAVDLTAILNASQSNGSAPLLVTFDVGATGTIDSVWALDFGDGATPVNGSDLPSSVDHTYPAAGEFPVVL